MFNYDTTNIVFGTIIRDDTECSSEGNKLVTIIKLDDGRVVLDTECQYGLLAVADEAKASAGS
jgi:tRNA A37 threonylcarbamoyladenosine synthetase subunit TsaC/SUA5/YrdC